MAILSPFLTVVLRRSAREEARCFLQGRPRDFDIWRGLGREGELVFTLSVGIDRAFWYESARRQQ